VDSDKTAQRAARAGGRSAALPSPQAAATIFILSVTLTRKSIGRLNTMITVNKITVRGILPVEDIRVKITGNIIEARHMTHNRNYYSEEEEIDKTRNNIFYLNEFSENIKLDMKTGEVFDDITEANKPAKTRMDNPESVKKSIRKLRDLLNTNFAIPKNCKTLTLTYAENMTDPNRLYEDTRRFIQKLRRYCLKKKQMGFEYITCIEPQGRGSFHHHMLLIFPREAPFLPADDLRAKWGLGRLKIEKSSDVDNLGAYLSAYLTDVSVDDAPSDVIMDAVGKKVRIKTLESKDGKTKRYLKGQRLRYFPEGFNIYRTSRNVKQPEFLYMTYGEMLRRFPNFEKTYESTLELVLDGSPYNIITYHQFKKKPYTKEPYSNKNGQFELPCP
jgi:hypothetical protein